MSNANRDYAIVYDVKNSLLVLSRPLIFYITDKNTSNIFVKLVTRVIVGDGIDQYTDIENASSYVLTMRVIKPNNEVKSIEATQHEPESIFQFDLTEDFKDIPGKYICELTISTIVNERQELITSDPFNYEVKRSILSNVGEIIETEDTTVEKLLNNLEATRSGLQTQINNLVLGAVGDGNNAEVVQARGKYDTLNDRITASENKIEGFFETIECDKITEALPFAHNFSSESGWLADHFTLKNTKWSDYEYVFVAIEMSVTGPIKDMALSSISTGGKYLPEFQVYDNYELLTDDKRLTEGKRFVHLSGFHIDSSKIAEHQDAKLLFVQYGNSTNIGNPTITIHNIVIYKSQSSDYSDALDLFYKNGFSEYAGCIDYGRDIVNKPAINGIELTKDSAMDDFKQPIGDIISDELYGTSTLLYRNYMKDYNISTISFDVIDSGTTGVTKTIENGCPRFKLTTVNNSGNAYLFSTNFNIPNYQYIANHTYLFALQLHVNEYKTSNQTSTAGNVNAGYLAPTAESYLTQGIYATYETIQDIATVGADCNIVSYATIDATKLADAPKKNAFNLQFTFHEAGTVIDFTIKNIAVFDATELNLQTSNEMYERFNKYKYVKNDIYDKFYDIRVREALTASQGGSATENKPSIEIWGDSLVAQGYGNYIGEYLGREVLTRGYGGKTSTYVRDKFLAEADTNKTIIINVGRNNFYPPDVVIQDIRAMVAAIPHHNFLICCPPNGHWDEGKGSGSYPNFQIIEDRLSRQYGANFLNTRVGTIEEYDMGNVKLIDSFTQPEINGQVTIKVSDAAFLTTYNQGDTERWGQDFMKKIVIGQSIYAVDTYRVDSYDTNANTLTITLLENNSGVTPGSTVSNGVDNGGLNSVKYLRVLQYADYYCFINDITQSTFRIDGIHMSENGKKCLAKIVARKINSMKI